MKTYFKIPIDDPKKEFENHLFEETNRRILFSGRFGIGKTYFLKKFFSDNEKYETFYLSPINYQVTSNEDVFELVKYDILLELISKGFISKDDEEISEKLAFQFYLIKKSPDIILNFLSLIPKLGKAASIAKQLMPFIKNFKEYVKELDKNDFLITEEFAKKIESSSGSIYENDFVSQILYSSIIENKSKDKENILIIDELDRIDPEHIFRIFNVFSAHFDLETDIENKFGFDRVIFVCDLENIRKIFNAKYGQDVDFSGYIDKFYSNECFHFYNDKAVYLNINKIFTSIQSLCKSNTSNSLIEKTKCFIIDFIKAKSINLRDLENITKIKNPFSLKHNFYLNNYNFSDNEFFEIKVFFILFQILGNDINKLLSCFQKCRNNLNTSAITHKLAFIKSLFPFVDLNNFSLPINKGEEQKKLTIPEYNLEFDYVIFQQPYFYSIELLDDKGQIKLKYEDISTNQFYYLLEIVYKNLLNIIADNE